MLGRFDLPIIGVGIESVNVSGEVQLTTLKITLEAIGKFDFDEVDVAGPLARRSQHGGCS